jgi:ribokinase
MITKVGNDTFGKVALDNFKNENMDTKFIIVDEKHETGAALIMVDENTSENEILVLSGACGYISDEDVEAARGSIENTELFLTQLEINMDAIEKAVDVAHKKGVKTVLNPAPVQPVSDELLKKIDIIIPNEVEASILTGIKIENNDDVRKAAEVFLNKGVKEVIITLGSKGVYARTKDTEKFVPVMPVKAIDTTGAGDAFCGGFVTALAEGKDFFKAVEFGNVVGALSVTRLGTAPAMPYREEIEKYL